MSMYHHVSGYQLPHYLSIEIEHTGNSKHVIVHSTIHVNKVNRTNMSYSDEFTDDEILNDELKVLQKLQKLAEEEHSISRQIIESNAKMIRLSSTANKLKAKKSEALQKQAELLLLIKRHLKLCILMSFIPTDIRYFN